MDKNNNDLLITYLDSLETSDIYSNYKFKKIPSLNQYAENYLANLDNLKSINELNTNNNINKFNDNNSSIKALSNDITNNDSIMNTNIQTNQISKVYEIFSSNKTDDFSDIEKLKTKSNLAIEHLKKNFQIKTKTPYSISKIKNKNLTKKKDINYLSNVSQSKSINFLSDLYKKISPSERTRLNSPLFSALKSTDSKCSSTFKVFIDNNNNNNNDNLNFSKSVNSYNDNKNNKIKSFLSKNGMNENNIKMRKIKKKISMSYLYKNILSSYICSDRDKCKTKFNNINKKNKSKNIRLQMKKFSEVYNNEESTTPFQSVTNRNNQNKSHSHSIEDYWKEKELKKQIKIEKIRKEKIMKENREMRDKPKINENSRKIADKINYSSSINVFERLCELKKNQLIYNQKISNIKTENENSIGKIKVNKEKNFQNYNKRNKMEIETEYYFRSLKQFENGNKNLIDKINSDQGNQQKNPKLNANRNANNTFINVKRNTGFINNNESIKFFKNGKKQFNISENDLKISNKSLDKSFVKPKVVYKKIKLKKNRIDKDKQNRNNISNINGNNKLINSDIIYKVDNSMQMNRNNKILLYNNSKENQSKNSTQIYDNKSQIFYPVDLEKTKNNNINNGSYHKYLRNINKGNTLLNRNDKLNKINKNNYKSMCNYKYKNGNITKLNSFKDIYHLKENGKKSNLNNRRIKNKNISNDPKLKLNNICLNENDLIENKLFKSCMGNSDNYRINDFYIDNNKIVNCNLINTKKYFKMPLKNEVSKDKDLRERVKTEYSTYGNDYINDNDNDYDNISLNVFQNFKREKDNNLIGGIKNTNNYNNNNINSYGYIKESEQKNNVKRRRLDLLKLLNFSSKIGIDYNNNKY